MEDRSECFGDRSPGMFTYGTPVETLVWRRGGCDEAGGLFGESFVKDEEVKIREVMDVNVVPEVGTYEIGEITVSRYV